MTVWFTADTHFRHRNLIAKGHREGFDTVEDHDRALIERWNDRVRRDDTVWHLGDFAMGPARDFLPIVARLHGTIHLITGNHDAPWAANRDSARHQRVWLDAGFASVQAFARRRAAGRDVLLSHFPYEGDHKPEDRAGQYRLRDEGVPLIHGHVHGLWWARNRQLNVGVDVNDFQPVPLALVEDWVSEVAS